ncbi:MAG: hypothetical protein LQ346_007749 [Caloplaca aetnensis]|nr:MAG: hypothetical protein LQ346_007749 [Caloplaca aetnensis]
MNVASQVYQAVWSARWLLLLLAVSTLLLFRDFESTTRGVEAPIAGRWRFEPYFLTGLRFKGSSMLHLTAGYNKNLYGKSTTTDVLLKSDLQAKVLRNRLTPNLQDFVASSLEEIEYSAEKELPASQDNRPLDLLQYMIEGAQGEDLEPERLAHLQLMVNLAGIHTTSAAITHAIYDLCEHPEYVNELREETEEVLRLDGGWQKGTHSKLHKLDSFLKESQRFSPPTLLSFNRVVLTPLTLSNGTHIPAGTHISVASRHIQFDPDVTPDPDNFDGLRYYWLRQQAPTDSHRHDFANADGTNMNFGAGRYACPGRFFASMELKMLLAHLLLKYDFRFPPGTVTRPPNLVIDEFLGPNPWAKILLRKRHRDFVGKKES